MEKKNVIKECEALKRAVHRLRTHRRIKMPKGYRKDPKEYEETTLPEHSPELQEFEGKKKRIKLIFQTIGDIEEDEEEEMFQSGEEEDICE